MVRRSSNNNDIIHEDIDKELWIDDEALNGETIDQPLTFRKYTRIKAECNAKAKTIKQKLKETEAMAYLEFAKEGKKVKELDSMVETDEEVIKLRHELIDAEQMVEEFEGIVRAFHQRHDSLKDLCANRRKELID